VNKRTSAVKVLVVDDQPMVVAELCEFLENSGYRCVPCESGQQAIERFQQDTSGKHRAFEAIMLTGQADKQDVIKALRAGVADYYQKPIDLTELLEGVQRQEVVLQERHKALQLGHLNQKLQYLSESLDDLYEDLDRVRRTPSAPGADDGTASDKERVEIPAIFSQLSPRQLDVARLVGKGQTNYQIACELGITENTVKLYVSQVLRLTHMHNRTQLALALTPSNSGGRHRLTAN
jgi:DNA-binding NarL/FixJ family response regulator